MMFTEVLAEAIVEGQKTQTRRRQSSNPRSPWREPRLGGCTYDVGQTFTINPGRGVKRIAEAEVVAVRLQPLHALRPQDARAEGFPTRDAFIEAWKKINGGWWPDEEVWVIEFKLVGGPHGNGPCRCADCLLEATCA